MRRTELRLMQRLNLEKCVIRCSLIANLLFLLTGRLEILKP